MSATTAAQIAAKIQELVGATDKKAMTPEMVVYMWRQRSSEDVQSEEAEREQEPARDDARGERRGVGHVSSLGQAPRRRYETGGPVQREPVLLSCRSAPNSCLRMPTGADRSNAAQIDRRATRTCRTRDRLRAYAAWYVAHCRAMQARDDALRAERKAKRERLTTKGLTLVRNRAPKRT
jgi:hypothetical protein